MKFKNLNYLVQLFFILCFLYQGLWAEIKVSSLFSDGMVLQRKVRVPVWGWGNEPGSKVKVVFGEQKQVTAVDESGKWMLYLDPLEASSKPAELHISIDEEVKVIKNVLVGEVWLCSGQSNMAYTMKGILSPAKNKKYQPIVDIIEQETKKAKDPLLRQIQVPNTMSPFEGKNNFIGKWIESTPENNPQFTATGYYFARKLRRELKVPVALIKSAWGGTIIEPWISKDGYQSNERMKKFYEMKLSAVKEKLKTWNHAEEREKHKKKMQEWQEKKKEAIAAKKPIPRKPRHLSHPDGSPSTPSTLYNSMINPLVPYAMKGVIWYQGESNALYGEPSEFYGEYLEALISSWRKAWGQGDFPFYYAQLASWRKSHPEPVETDRWAIVCDLQRQVLQVKNTGMAVLNDIGEANDIHPKNKIDAGERLALWALVKDYGIPLVCSGPLYQNSRFAGSKVKITFSYTGEGLMVGNKNLLDDAVEVSAPLKGFQICGSDRKWKWAEAKIISGHEVEVFNDGIKNPVEVRYAWSQNPEGANLYNKAGLPASVFKAVKQEK